MTSDDDSEAINRDAVDRLFDQSPPTLGTTWFVIRDELKDTLRKGANTKRDTGPVLVIRTETKQGD